MKNGSRLFGDRFFRKFVQIIKTRDMKRILLTLATVALSAAAAHADEARLLRFPATNSSEVAFSYAGDLWTVPIQGGEARRLTSHIGYEMFARYSPVG